MQNYISKFKNVILNLFQDLQNVILVNKMHPESGQARLTTGRFRNTFGVTLSIVFIFSLLFFLLAPVFAQQVSLSIYPPHLELFIKPGKAVLIAYKVENFGDPTTINTKVLPFEPRDYTGGVKIKNQFEGPVRFSLDNADLALEQPFFLQTKESKQLLLRIRIPEGAPEGDYYYAFLVESQPAPQQEGQASSQAQAAIGSTILIAVTESGNLEANAKVALFDLTPRLKLGNLRIFDSSDKIPVTLIVQNAGKNMVKPQGQITLRGNFGEQAKYDILPQNILAQSQRLLSATPSAQINCDQENSTLCKKNYSLLLSGFFLGNYKLSTSINFGQGTSQIFASTSFIAIPLKFFLGLFAVIFISIILIRKSRKS